MLLPSDWACCACVGAGHDRDQVLAKISVVANIIYWQPHTVRVHQAESQRSLQLEMLNLSLSLIVTPSEY